MLYEKHFTRRNFLKVGSLSLLLGRCNKQSNTPELPESNEITIEPSPAPQINPLIENNRVICCHDPQMVTGGKGGNFHDQNNGIDTKIVKQNIDKMAMTLANKSTISEAWATIFRKPETKTWDQVKCAIKVNCITTKIMPRIAIVNAICTALIQRGVQPEHIIIYDACHNASGDDKYTPYIGKGLPTGVKVSIKDTSELGGRQNYTLDKNLSEQPSCTAHIANGTIDILINCAVNKGHIAETGGATLCMKNHFGTFTPFCHLPADSKYLLAYMIKINKTDAIIGGTPNRQQLCIIDSLWAAQSGPTSSPSHTPGRIVMGIFAPVVDYLTIMKIRKDVMGIPPKSNFKNTLTAFQYNEEQINSLDFIYV